MTVPGHDPDDLDATLERAMADRDPAEFLSGAERERWADGEGLSELLDGDDIDRLIGAAEADD